MVPDFTDFLPKTRVLLPAGGEGNFVLNSRRSGLHGKFSRNMGNLWYLVFAKAFCIARGRSVPCLSRNDCGTSGSAGYGLCGNFSRYLEDLACVESFHGIFSKLF